MLFPPVEYTGSYSHGKQPTRLDNRFDGFLIFRWRFRLR
jgi:hypothetical protein